MQTRNKDSKKSSHVFDIQAYIEVYVNVNWKGKEMKRAKLEQPLIKKAKISLSLFESQYIRFVRYN